MSKGYIYKSDYGAINQWVIDAIGIQLIDKQQSQKSLKESAIYKYMEKHGVDMATAIKEMKEKNIL